MTANNSMTDIESEISLTQLWLPKPDVCRIDETRATAYLKWRNPYNDTRIAVTVKNDGDGACSKWTIWERPLYVEGVSYKTNSENTSDLARRLARQWAAAKYDAISARRFREIDNTIHLILNSPLITVQDDARSDLMGVLDDIAREHGGDYQRLGL